MSHRRTDIRKAIVEMLRAGSTSAQSRIYDSRFLPLSSETYPMILVYSREEAGESLGITPMPAERRSRIAIQIQAAGGPEANLDESLDDIALQVETLMNANPSVGGLANAMNYVSTEIDVSTDGERPIGGLRLTYELTYVD